MRSSYSWAFILGALLFVVTAAFTYSSLTLSQRIDALEAELTARMDYGDRKLEQFADSTEGNAARLSLRCVALEVDLQRTQDDITELQSAVMLRKRH